MIAQPFHHGVKGNITLAMHSPFVHLPTELEVLHTRSSALAPPLRAIKNIWPGFHPLYFMYFLMPYPVSLEIMVWWINFRGG